MEFSTEMVLQDYSFESTTLQLYRIPTEDKTPTSHKAPLLLYDVLIPTLGVLIILLNFAVVVSSGLILKRGQQPRSTYMFLGNVALTDLITGIAVIFGQVFPKQYRNHYICATQLGMIVSSTLASVYSVGLIAIDRYLYILHGLQYQIWVYPTRVKVFIITSWIVGCVIGFLPLMGWYGDTDNGRVCWFILMAPKELILLTVLVGIIPLITVIVLYSIILYRALKKIIQLSDTEMGGESKVAGQSLRIFRGKGTISEEPNSEQPETPRQIQNSKAPSKWKAIKVVVFTTSSFVITWSPYFVVSLWYGYECYDKQTSLCKTLRILIASPLAILGFANSLINPIIYAWWHKGFRKFVKRKFNRIRMIRKETREITSSTRTGTSRSVLGSKSSSASNVSSIPTASYTASVSDTME